MMKIKSLGVIICTVFLFLGGVGTYTYINKNSTKLMFQNDGYIIKAKEDTADSYTRLAFFKETGYEIKYPDKITFHDIDSRMVSADLNSFVHYNNGSIAALNDSVLVDLNDVEKGVYNYYGLSRDNIMEASGNSYVLNNMITMADFSDFLWKLGEDKYLLVSEEITISFAEQETRSYQGFVELQYYNQGILLLLSEEDAYRTVSSDCIATLRNGLKLDLASRTILQEDTVCMSLEQMVVGADDNIDVLAPIKSVKETEKKKSEKKDIQIKIPTFEVIDGADGEVGEKGTDGIDGEEGEKGLTGEDGEKGMEGAEGLSGEDGTNGNLGNPGAPGTTGTTGITGENGTSGGSGASGAAGVNGAVGAEGISGDQLLQEEISSNPPAEDSIHVVLPVFELTNLKSSANTVSGEIKITDEDGILDSQYGVVIKVLYNADGREVTRTSYSTDLSFQDFTFDGLQSDKEYRIVVSANYLVNNISYEKIFINKAFTTDALGLLLNPIYVLEDSLGFFIKKTDYSHVLAADLQLTDMSGNPIISTGINISAAGTAEGCTIDFVNSLSAPIQSNTYYKVRFANIQYDASVNTGTTSVTGEQVVQTLKKKPVIGIPVVVVNKMDGVFDLQLTSVTDPDKGIMNYRYEIYECDAAGNMVIQTPVKSILSTNLNVIPFEVDGQILLRNRYYKARAVAVFFDNEKQVEHAGEFSSVFGMAGTNYPTIEFQKDEAGTHHDRIKGDIIIHSNGSVITASAAAPLEVTYMSSRGNVNTVTYSTLPPALVDTSGNDYFSITFNEGNLLADDNYIVSVYGTLDLNDGAGAHRGFLGNVVVQTDVPNALMVNITQQQSVGAQMAFSLHLSDIVDGASSQYEASTLEYLQVNVYNGDASAAVSSSPVATYVMAGDNGENYQSTLEDQVYDNTVLLNESILGVNMSLITTSQYTIQVTNVRDYTVYSNEIPLFNSIITLSKAASPPSLDSIDLNDGVTIIPISNADSGSYGAAYESSLSPNAIIGFEVKAKYDNSAKLAEKFIYYVYEQADYPSETAPTDFYNNTTKLLASKEVEPYAGSAAYPGAVFLFKDYERLSRGSKYRFNFRVELSNTAIYYPECLDETAIITSKTAEAPYCTPGFYFLPYSSGTNELSFQYYISAPDTEAVRGGFALTGAGTASLSSTAIAKNASGAPLTVNGLVKGNVPTITCSVNLFKQAYYPQNNTTMTVVKQYFEGVYSETTVRTQLTFTGEDDESANRVRFTVTDSASSRENLRRLVALHADVMDASNTFLKSVDIPINSVTDNVAECFLSYADISELVGNTLRIQLSALYDSGVSGYGLVDGSTRNCAIQTISDHAPGNYINLNYLHDNIQVNDSGNAINSFFNFSSTALSFPVFTCDYVSMVDNNFSKTMSLQTGLIGTRNNSLVDNNLITIKEIKQIELQNKTGGITTEYFELAFDSMLPTINLNSGDAYTITTTADTATVRWKLYGQESVINTNKVKDNKMYFDLYEINPDGTRSLLSDGYSSPGDKLVSTDISKDIISYETIISSLSVNKKYGITIYYVETGTEIKKYPIDMRRPTQTNDTIMFTFMTNDSIVITPEGMQVVSGSYHDKRIELAYSVNDTLGYRMVYTLYRINPDGATYTVIKSSEELAAENIIQSPGVMLSDMVASLSFTPGKISWLEGGNRVYFPFGSEEYYLGMKPVSVSDHVTALGNEVYIKLKLNDFRLPYYNISTTPLSDTSIRYQISVIDTDNVLVNNHYKIRVYDAMNQDITPATIASRIFNSLIPASFDLTGLVSGSNYELRLYTVLDYDNSGRAQDIELIGEGDLLTCLVKTKTSTTLDAKGYYFGKITMAAAPNEMARVYFENSVNLLDNISYVEYIVVSPSGQYSAYSQPFSLTDDDTDSSLKYYELLHHFLDTGSYVVQFRFFDAYGVNLNEDMAMSYFKAY